MVDKTDFTVESKTEIRILDKETGEVSTGYRIWARSKGGTRFHVDVPEDKLDKADEFLSKRAKELDAI